MMHGKYIIVKKGAILALTVVLTGSTLLGCSSDIKVKETVTEETEQKEVQQPETETVMEGTQASVPETGQRIIKQSELASLSSRMELGYLTTCENFRAEWENILEITGEPGQKEGVFYRIWGDELQDASLGQILGTMPQFGDFTSDEANYRQLAEAVKNNFTDTDGLTDKQLFGAGLNAYFQLLPLKDETKSYADAYLSRAQFSVIMANITNDNTDNISWDDKFDKELISRGEAIDACVRKVYCSETELENIDADSDEVLSDVINGGDIAAKHNLSSEEEEIRYVLQHPEEGCPEKMYHSLVKAYKEGMISDETGWTEGITLSEAVSLYFDMMVWRMSDLWEENY